eukprot:scaffold54446_cov14-Tisochrysis_lutea.AAC.1
MVVFGRKGGAGLARWRLELWAKPVALLKPSGLCRGCHRVCPKSSIKVSVWARNRPPEFLDIEATADLNAVRSVKFARDAC